MAAVQVAARGQAARAGAVGDQQEVLAADPLVRAVVAEQVAQEDGERAAAARGLADPLRAAPAGVAAREDGVQAAVAVVVADQAGQAVEVRVAAAPAAAIRVDGDQAAVAGGPEVALPEVAHPEVAARLAETQVAVAVELEEEAGGRAVAAWVLAAQAKVRAAVVAPKAAEGFRAGRAAVVQVAVAVAVAAEAVESPDQAGAAVVAAQVPAPVAEVEAQAVRAAAKK